MVKTLLSDDDGERLGDGNGKSHLTCGPSVTLGRALSENGATASEGS